MPPLKNMSVTRHIAHTRKLFNFQDMTPLFSLQQRQGSQLSRQDPFVFLCIILSAYPLQLSACPRSFIYQLKCIEITSPIYFIRVTSPGFHVFSIQGFNGPYTRRITIKLFPGMVCNQLFSKPTVGFGEKKTSKEPSSFCLNPSV